MFSDWTDPNDTDSYYNNVEEIYQNVRTAPSSAMYQQMPSRPSIISTPEQPTGVIVNQIVPPASTTEPAANTAPLQKSAFESKPDNYYMNYPVPTVSNTTDPVLDIAYTGPLGKQPAYNILRSGAPMREKFPEVASNMMSSIDMTHVVLFIILLVLSYCLIKCRSDVSMLHMILARQGCQPYHPQYIPTSNVQ